MTTDMLLVFVILGAAIILFASERLRLDLVAILALLALVLTGLITPAQSLAGFSDSVVIMIAGLFVVGAGLFQTGIADALGNWLEKTAGKNPTHLIVAIMGVAALLSAFMSSTGTTAILIPVVVSLARKSGTQPSKLLIPLAYASLIGGVLTLIGTPPNIVVSNLLASSGLRPFGFFEFTPVGLVVLAVGMGFILLAGRRMLPARETEGAVRRKAGDEALSLADLAEAYELPGNLYRLRLLGGSGLEGCTLAEANMRTRYGVNVLAVKPWLNGVAARSPARLATPETLLRMGDVLHVQGSSDAVARMAGDEMLAILPREEGTDALIPQELGMAEVLLTPRSRLIGRSLQDARFRDTYHMTVVAIRRMGRPLESESSTTPLRFGDTLLVQGTWSRIALLQEDDRDFVVVGMPGELATAQRKTSRAPIALAIMIGMLVLMTADLVPHAIAVLMAAAAMVLTGCLTMEDAYRSMNWQSLILIAGMLPMSSALQNTGGVQYVADGLIAGLGGWGPIAVMAGLFLLTGFFSQFISNTATTVLVAPIALEVARSMNVSPYAFLMAVAVAASTAFATPIATPSNTLVLGPGGYRFSDYLKIGISLQAVIMVVTLLVLPLLFPM